jgi:hypothetical protein
VRPWLSFLSLRTDVRGKEAANRVTINLWYQTCAGGGGAPGTKRWNKRLCSVRNGPVFWPLSAPYGRHITPRCGAEPPLASCVHVPRRARVFLPAHLGELASEVVAALPARHERERLPARGRAQLQVQTAP